MASKLDSRRRASASAATGGFDLKTAVTAFALSQPQMGQASVAAALCDQGIAVSPSGVRYLWRKRGLETKFKRLKALEQAGPQLNDSQRDILRRGETARRFARRSVTAANTEDQGTIARRELIIAAAAELFVDRGYAGTSMRDIAAKVGLLAGSLYHYYRAKDKLFVAVQKEGFRQIMERVERAIAKASDPWMRLELACAEHVHSVVAGDAISRVTATGLFGIHEAALQRRLRVDHDRYERVFRDLIDALSLRYVDRSLFRLTLFGAMNWTLVWYRSGRLSPSDIARSIVALLREGAQRTGKRPQASAGTRNQRA